MKKLIYLILISLVWYSCSEKKEIPSESKDSISEDSEGITLKSGIVVEKRGSVYILDGDMILFPEQLKALDEKGTLTTDEFGSVSAETTIHPVFNVPMSAINPETSTLQRNLGMYPDPFRLWAMVRFTYGASIWNHPNRVAMQQNIRQALNHIEVQTNVRFYNATGQPTIDPTFGFAYPYIEINSIGSAGASSSSHIGRNPSGGRQLISLSDGSFPGIFGSNVSTIIHELCHAIGMMHEQNRPDRDAFVTINNANLTPLGRSQFQIVSTNYSYIGAYDYESVMAYNSFANSLFAVNPSQPMYTRRDGTFISPSTTLTNLDRTWLNNFHYPYIARSDAYRELSDVVYRWDNSILTPAERLQLQASLNNGNPNPPAGGRIPNEL